MTEAEELKRLRAENALADDDYKRITMLLSEKSRQAFLDSQRIAQLEADIIAKKSWYRAQHDADVKTIQNLMGALSALKSAHMLAIDSLRGQRCSD